MAIINLMFKPLTRQERTVSTICMDKLLGSDDGSWKVIPLGNLGVIVRVHAESLDRAKAELVEGWGARLEALVESEAEKDGRAGLWSELKRFLGVEADTFRSLESKLVDVELAHVW